jgi:uncharacterized OB-fold protein
MTVRSTPVRAAYADPYWDATEAGGIAIQVCRSCTEAVFPPFPECLACGSDDLKWTPTSGTGVVQAFSIVRDPILPGLEDQLPLHCALVRIDGYDTAVIPTNLVAEPGVVVEVGQRVEAVFEPCGVVQLPLFRPLADSPSAEVIA